MSSFFADYSDGKSAKIHQVKVVFTNEHLEIEGFTFNTIWPYHELEKTEKTKRHFSLFRGDKFPYEILSFDDPNAYQYFQNLAPENKVFQEAHLKFDKAGPKAYYWSFIGIVAVLALFHFVLIPFSVNQIAKKFPVDMEAKLGENYLHIAQKYGLMDSAKTATLQEFADELDFQTDYELNFYLVESDMVNAFALPGGKIVVFSALIDSMTSYHQLVSLLGHETGHVELRHSLQSIFRDQSYEILLNILSGGNSKVVESYIGIASSLNSLHSSRTHEQQADNYALKVLLHNHCDPRGVVELFEVLAQGGESPIPDMLSTHPSSQNRIEELNAQIQDLDTYKVLINEQLETYFKALQKPMIRDEKK